MLKEDKEIRAGRDGCVAIVLFFVFSIVVSIAVGVFLSALVSGLSPLPCSSCSRSPSVKRARS